jgi:hypothetical protein
VRSDAFTYRVEPHSATRLLVVVGGDHERRAGALPATAAPAASAERLAAVRAALGANGVEADTYDVEAHGHVAPDPLGVLGHYEAVVWTTDEQPRTNSTAPVLESVSRLANEEMLAARDYLNEGGRLLYMGRDAGRPYADGAEYDPVADGPCKPAASGVASFAESELTGGGGLRGGCVALSDDFFQFWLGAYQSIPASRAGSATAPVDGVRPPFDGLSWTFADSGIGGGHPAAAYAATAETLGAAFPDLPGRLAARYRFGRQGAGAGPPGRAGSGDATGAAIETPSSLLFGFGLEDIATAAQQAQVMGRALSFLLPAR